MERVTPPAFTDLISRLMAESGASPDHIAARLGVRSKSIWYRFENGTQEPTVSQINTLASIFGVSADRLFVALGAHLSPPESANLPPRLVQAALRLSRARQRQLEDDALGLLLLEESERGEPR